MHSRSDDGCFSKLVPSAHTMRLILLDDLSHRIRPAFAACDRFVLDPQGSQNLERTGTVPVCLLVSSFIGDYMYCCRLGRRWHLGSVLLIMENLNWEYIFIWNSLLWDHLIWNNLIQDSPMRY